MIQQNKAEDSIGTLAEPGTASLLRVLGTMLLFTGIILIALHLSLPGSGARPGTVIMVIIGVLMRLFVRIGKLRWAANLMCWGIMVAGWSGAYLNGGLMAISWVGMPIATMAGGWLLGRRSAIMLAAAASASVLIMLWLHLHGHVFTRYNSIMAAVPVHITVILFAALIGSATAEAFRQKLNLLAESRAQMTALFDSTNDLIWSVDPKSFGLLTFNAGLRDHFKNLLDIDVGTGMRPEDLFSSDERARMWHEMYRRALDEGAYSTEYETHDGTKVLNLSFNVLRQNGQVFGVSVFGKDITERKAAEERIRQLAYFDPLTQLTNRRLLLDRLGHALFASHRDHEYGALLMLDLDHFKILNDTRGHDMGDRLLVEVAQRLKATVRLEDTISRLGGDEFVVMLEGLGREEQSAANLAEQVAEKVCNALSQPYFLNDETVAYRITTSIGLTLFRGQETTIEGLMKQADVALYQAKDAGRNTVRFFNPEMQAAINARSAMDSALRRGMVQSEFRLFYQPQVDQDGHLIGAEALVRWLDPERGMVPPIDFIPLAEESGLIIELGQWVLDTACAQLSAWGNDPRTRALQLSVNVSARQFRQPDFVERVRRTLADHGANPALLKLELTESIVLENVDGVITRMEELNGLGVLFSLDDFGMGYSSLSYLKRLPLDQVKIDQSFVRDLATDQNDAAIVQAILAMSRSLGLHVIAEGVETQAQRAFLLEHGCLAYQGYLFGKPMPIEEWDLSLLSRAPSAG